MKKLIVTLIILACVVSPRAYSQEKADKKTTKDCDLALSKGISIIEQIMRQDTFVNSITGKVRTFRGVDDFVRSVVTEANLDQAIYKGKNSRMYLTATICHRYEKNRKKGISEESFLYFKMVLPYKEWCLVLDGELTLSLGPNDFTTVMKNSRHLLIRESPEKYDWYVHTQSTTIHGNETTLSRFLE